MAFSKAFLTAGKGPIPILSQWTPAIVRAIISARGLIEFEEQYSSFDTRTAAAPTEIGLLVAAVMEPPSIKAGFKLLIFSSSGSLGPSSLETVVSPLTFIGINSAEIKNHEQNKNMLEVTVEFVSEIISHIKDKENKTVSGDPEKIKKVHDIWKFSKDSRSINPNWVLIDTQA